MLYAFGDYTLDTQRYELRRAGTLCPLEPHALELLVYLLQHRDRVVTKQELLEQLWPERYVGPGVLTQRLMMVRKALGESGRAPRCITTLHGRGYRFVAAVAVSATAPGDEDRPPEALHTSNSAPHPAPATMPAAVAAPGLLSLPDATAGEPKQVTILCCTLEVFQSPGVPSDPERLYHGLQAYFAQAQQVMQRFDGTMIPYGSQGFLALFGAPQAQEDHARRAVTAAWELRRSVQTQPLLRDMLPSPALALRLGLHTGLTIVGQSVTHPQWLYAAADTITVATRLQQAAAPDTILLSAATWQLVHDEVEGEAHGTFTVAVGAAPLPVYTVARIARRRAGVSGRSRRAWRCFVGRARELAMLHAGLERVREGDGQVIGISGEPGLGKSRLLAEFRRSIRGQPLRYCEGHCLSYGRTTPYGPVLDVLRQLWDILDTDGQEVITAKVAQHLQEAGIDPEAEAALLLHLLDVPVSPAQVLLRSPEERRDRLFALLRQVTLHSSQHTPLLLAVENLHWIDATSEAWLASLVECLTAASILLVVTYRPGYQPSWLGQSVATQMALPRLRPDESRTVLQTVLQSTPLPEALLPTLITRAAGNPFFLEELAWAVQEQRSDTGALAVPDTVQSVLAARLDHLPPVEKRLLQSAAVIGTEVAVPLLQAIVDVPAETISQSLTHLQATEFLYETRLFPERIYTFKHALTHEVAYGSLLHERRRTLHVRIVAVLESLSQARLAEQVDRLAYHAVRGEVWAKAVTYCQQAGTKANDRAAFREAVAHWEQALQALAHLPEDNDTRVLGIDLRHALILPLNSLGEQERRLALLGEAETLARALNDRARLGQVLADMTHVLRVMGDPNRAMGAGQQALALSTELGDSALQVEASLRLGQICYATGDFIQAAVLLRHNVEIMDSEGDRHSTDMRIGCWAWLALTLSVLGVFTEGRRHGEEALHLATLAGRGNPLIIAYVRLGQVYLTQGDLEHAISMLEQGLTLCRASDHRELLRWAAAGLGSAYALQGRLAEGYALLEEAIRESLHTGGLQGHADRVMRLSEVCRLAGRAEESWQHAHQALALARQQQERGNEALTLHQLGVVQAHANPPDAVQAEAYYQQALDLAEALGMRPLQAHCHAALGTLYARTDRWEQARAELSAARALYQAMDMTFWLPQTEAMLAQVL